MNWIRFWAGLRGARADMAQVELPIAGRRYAVACRDGEEEHLFRLAAMIDRKCGEATQALGTMAEPRLLFTAALLLADELSEAEARGRAVPPPQSADKDDQAVTARLAAITARVEKLHEVLERRSLLS